jgi:hypothetical protein
VQIKQNDGYFSVNADCSGLDVSQTNCLINLPTLTAAPYNLVQGNQVVAQVIATNVIGDSPASAISTAAALVALPHKPQTPTRSDASDLTSITINILPLESLATGGLSLLSYSVYWDAGSGTDPTQLYNETTNLFALFSSLTTSTTYKFAIKGKNELGEGEASNTLTLVCATKPSIITSPTTEIQGSNVLISWIAPTNGGSTILSYRIQVADALGLY